MISCAVIRGTFFLTNLPGKPFSLKSVTEPLRSSSTWSFKDILKFEAKSASIYTLMTFLQQAGSFLVVPLFWKRLDPADYGVLAVNDMVGRFISVFIGLQLETSITRFYYEWDTSMRNRQLGSVWVVSFASCVILGTIFIFAGQFACFYMFPDVPFYPFIFMGLISTVLRSLTATCYASIRIKQLSKAYVVYSMSIFITQLCLSIYFVVFLDMKLYGLLWSYIITDFINVSISIIIMLFLSTPCLMWDTIKQCLKFSLPYVPSFSILAVTNFVDRYFLQLFAGVEALGIYAICTKFAGLIGQLYNALKMSYVPFLSKAVSENETEGKKMISQMSLIYFLPLVAFALVIGLFTRDFVLLIGRLQYYPVMSYIPLFVPVYIVASFSVLFTPGLFLAKRSDLVWVCNIVQLAALLTGSILFIPTMEIYGVIIARYFSALSFFGVMAYFSKKYFYIPFQWHKITLFIVVMITGLGGSHLLISHNLILDIPVNLLIFILCITGLTVSLIGVTRSRAIISEMRPAGWRKAL
jgi:O-antigen/teichoic acid export membrane protein